MVKIEEEDHLQEIHSLEEGDNNIVSWYVYLLECLDGSYYTGITNNLEKRMDAHKSGKGSKYVFSRGFNKILKSRIYPSKSEALKAEYKIKQLPKEEKIGFFTN